MNDTERRLVYCIFEPCCPSELPENAHINIDLLRRVSEMPVSKIKRTLAEISSLGFYCYLRESSDEGFTLGELQPILVLEWHDRSIHFGGNYTELAGDIIDCATEGYCEQCGREALQRLDFCQLAGSTADIDQHSESLGQLPVEQLAAGQPGWVSAAADPVPSRDTPGRRSGTTPARG